MRDYLDWHRDYDDPESPLSRRLEMVRQHLRSELDARTGPVRIVSVCAGDGRDVLGVLEERADAERCEVTLVEILPELAQRAEEAAASLPSRPAVDVRVRDAGTTDAYAGVAPADVLVLVGVLGNITEDDVAATVAVLPQLVAPGGVVIWSQGYDAERRVPALRRLLTAAHFAETALDSFDGDSAMLGVATYDGPVAPLEPHRTFFRFVR